MMEKIKEWMKSPWLRDRRVMCALWFVIGVLSAVTKMSATRHNNYDIFRYVFYNTWQQTSLYAPSTDGGFWDLNHYGPFFSVIIAPFAVMPTWLGLLLWCTLLAVFLYWAVSRYCSIAPDRNGRESRGTDYVMPFMIWYCAHELLTALFMQQFNVAIAAIILLSFYFVEKERDEYATFFIVVGTLVKLYGIVGIAFFFFSKHKVKYILSLIAWTAVLFCLPMIISSPEYQMLEYREWFTCLGEKNLDNHLGGGTNISLMGMIRKIGYSLSVGREAFLPVMHGVAKADMSNWWMRSFNDLWVIVAGVVAMAVGYFRISQWKNCAFRHLVLATVMMFVCLFSTGTESSGYITALAGCVIWYAAVPWKRTNADIALMAFAFILTSLSPSDLFPATLRSDWVQPYALKALPVVLIWLKAMYELMTKDFKAKSPKSPLTPEGGTLITS